MLGSGAVICLATGGTARGIKRPQDNEHLCRSRSASVADAGMKASIMIFSRKEPGIRETLPISLASYGAGFCRVIWWVGRR